MADAPAPSPSVRTRRDLDVWLLTARDDPAPDAAIPAGPGAWLHIGRGDGGFPALAAGRTALARDMGAALTLIEIRAPDPLGALGLDPRAPGGRPVTTRLAHLRLTLVPWDEGKALLCVVPAPEADYFRHWLADRLRLALDQID